MSSPSPADAVLVRPEAVLSLAGELTALASELLEDADHCRVAAESLCTALDGDEGWTARAAATAWAGLEDVLAGRTAALAQVMTAAVDAYRAHDAGVARAIDPDRPAGPR